MNFLTIIVLAAIACTAFGADEQKPRMKMMMDESQQKQGMQMGHGMVK